MCNIYVIFFSYDDTEKPYIHFATKTAYRFNQNKDDDEIKHEGIWLSNVYSFIQRKPINAACLLHLMSS